MTYLIKAANGIHALDTAEKAHIACYPWGGEYRPEAYAQAIFLPDEAIVLRLTCHESDPRAEHLGFYSPVYQDSCLEFFFSFGGSSYVNIEMNANGAFLGALHYTRQDKKKLDELEAMPQVEAKRESDRWSVTLTLPLSHIEKLFGVRPTSGTAFRGNFYKCGDLTAVKHYGCWNEIARPSPDFHVPECFGELIIG